MTGNAHYFVVPEGWVGAEKGAPKRLYVGGGGWGGVGWGAGGLDHHQPRPDVLLPRTMTSSTSPAAITSAIVVVSSAPATVLASWPTSPPNPTQPTHLPSYVGLGGNGERLPYLIVPDARGEDHGRLRDHTYFRKARRGEGRGRGDGGGPGRHV